MFNRDWRSFSQVGTLIAAVCLGSLLSPYFGLSTPPSEKPVDESRVASTDQRASNPETWDTVLWNPVALSTVMVAIFTCVLTVAAILQLRGLRRANAAAEAAAHAAKLSADAALQSVAEARKTYVAEHRTWVEVSPISVAVTFPDGKATVHVTLVAENIGNSPATYVHMNCEAYIQKNYAVGAAAIERLVTHARATRSEVNKGFTLLSRGDKTPNYGFTLTAITDPEVTALFEAQRASGVTFEKVNLSLVYCVIYKSALMDEWFHSAHLAIIGKRDDGEFLPELGDVAVEKTKLTTIPFSDLLA